MNNLAEVNNLINSANNVIVMTGAGISTNAGIPDFRSKSIGLYNKIDQTNPTDVFSLHSFKRNPVPFYEIIFELYPAVTKAKPTIAHYFIKLLNDKNKLLKHYTQNVDCLENLTGLEQNKTIQCHGHIQLATCINCKKKFDFDFVKNNLEEQKIPACSKCKHVVKPDVVLFGEKLNFDFQKSTEDFEKCDLLIIMGTSLVVEPFASLPKINSKVKKIIINRELIKKCNDTKNIYFQTDCDDGCLKIAEMLGWKSELEKLFDENNQESNANKIIKTGDKISLDQASNACALLEEWFKQNKRSDEHS